MSTVGERASPRASCYTRVDRVGTERSENPINLLSVFSRVHHSVQYVERKRRKVLRGLNYFDFLADLSTANTPHAMTQRADVFALT